MELIPDWAPNIHPMLVHFPIAILFVAVFMDLLGFFIKKKWWDAKRSTLLYALGVISAIVVYFTGKSAADQVFVPTEAQNVLTNHADWAEWTVWFFGVYLLLRLGLHWIDRMKSKIIQIGMLLVATVGLFLLYETGEHGSQLVFGYGVGTGSLIEQEQEMPVISEDSLLVREGTTFQVENNGDIRWPIGPDGVSEMISRFTWHQGTAGQLKPRTIQAGQSNFLLQLQPDSVENLFVTNRSYRNVQLDLNLDISDFKGAFYIVHHLEDSLNYDFVRINSAGSLILGRLRDGSSEIYAKGESTRRGMQFIRVVSDGTHFRVYVNKELVAHGHGDAPPRGPAGIKLEGSGTLLIDRMTLVQL